MQHPSDKYLLQKFDWMKKQNDYKTTQWHWARLVRIDRASDKRVESLFFIQNKEQIYRSQISVYAPVNFVKNFLNVFNMIMNCMF